MSDGETFDVDAIKADVKERDCIGKEVNIGGKVYRVPVRNGNIEKQAAVFDAVDAWLGYTVDSEDDKSSRDGALRERAVVISILSLMNPIDEKFLYDYSTKELATKLYKIWREIE